MLELLAKMRYLVTSFYLRPVSRIMDRQQLYCLAWQPELFLVHLGFHQCHVLWFSIDRETFHSLLDYNRRGNRSLPLLANNFSRVWGRWRSVYRKMLGQIEFEKQDKVGQRLKEKAIYLTQLHVLFYVIITIDTADGYYLQWQVRSREAGWHIMSHRCYFSEWGLESRCLESWSSVLSYPTLGVSGQKL